MAEVFNFKSKQHDFQYNNIALANDILNDMDDNSSDTMSSFIMQAARCGKIYETKATILHKAMEIQLNLSK